MVSNSIDELFGVLPGQTPEARILLLSPPRQVVIKDAARAMKRVDSLAVEKITEETWSKLLGLSGMRVTRFAIEQQGEQKYLHLFCEHEQDVAICPGCKKVMSDSYDHKDRCVRHLDIWGIRTFIHFPQRRFECEVCGKPFTESLGWIDPKRRQTKAFEEYILQRIQKTSCKHVAIQEWLSESTVQDIFKKCVKEVIRQFPGGAVRVLGVDEISLRKGHKQYALVLSDLERRIVIKVLPNRHKDTLEEWFDNLTQQERRAIKVISMDMWNPYRQAVHKKLSHAQIVADRFHMVKQLNHQIDLIRRMLQKKANEDLYQILKGNRWLLLKNRCELKPKEEAELNVVLDASNELCAIYLLKEEFRTICEKIKDKVHAERFLQAWIWKAVTTGSRYLIRFVNTLRNWWQEFLNYFDDHVTQGFVEGINRAIRGIINRAFGYRNFDNFRLQVLVECGGT